MREASRSVRDAVLTGDALTARVLLREAPQARTDELLQDLAALASSGSTLAIELLLERLDASGVIRRFVSSMLLDESAVEDVSQDCLISVAGSIGQFEGRAKVTTWVHQIVRRRVVDHLRRQRSTTPLLDDELPEAVRMSSLIATRESVRAALDGLPELYREPVTLRDVEGLTYADVASRLGRNLGTIKAQVSRGRALVAASLTGQDGLAP